jgi:predicted nucleic acid-binding protein
MIMVGEGRRFNFQLFLGHALLGCSEILGTLYMDVRIPEAVLQELTRPTMPPLVREWVQQPPPWLRIVPNINLKLNLDLDPGESQAIELARESDADLVVLDDRKARQAAKSLGLAMVGTLGILRDAANHDLLDFSSAVSRLRDLGFYVSDEVLNLLEQEARKL